MDRRVIDDTGEMLHFQSPVLRQGLFLKTMLEADSASLLRNLGFIGICQGSGGVNISFRPRTVSRVAFAALNYWLHDRSPARVLLTILEAGHCPELHASAAKALWRMQSLIDAHQGSVEELFHRRAMPLGTMPSQALASLWAAWRSAGADCNFTSLRDLLRRDADSFVMLQPDLETGRFIIQDAGSGLRIPDPRWAKGQIGRPIAEMPDMAYGRWVGETYRSVLAHCEPQLDAVEADIYWPGSGRVLACYARLIVPVRDRGSMSLLGVVDPTCDIGGHLKAA